MKVHAVDGPTLGEPLCAGCYDYGAAAAFNWVAPELWRRFTITLPRTLARMCGMSAQAFERQVSIQYAKVAEFQRRGVVHFHAIIRMDGRPARDDEERWPVPPVHITHDQLAEAFQSGDGRWHGYVTMGVKSDGSPDRRHVTGQTEKAATTKVRKLERERDAGQVANAGRSPTVERWMTTYLDTIAARSLAPRTYDDYWSKARNWIIPNLGRHRLDRLQPEHLDSLYAKMLDVGKAESHVVKVHRIISRALSVAVRRRKVARNVAELVDPPSIREVESKPLDQDEARRLVVEAEGRRNGSRWLVGLARGLRQGEALGVRWQYVDLDSGDVRVWWQLQRGKWRHGCTDPHRCGARLHREPCPADCRRHADSCCPRPCPPDCTRHASGCPQRKGGGLVFREPKGKSRE